MRRYFFHIHLLGRVNRDHIGSFHATNSQAVAHGRSVADEIAEDDSYRSVVVTVERAGGVVLARVSARRAMPPWQSANSRFEHAWRELDSLDNLDDTAVTAVAGRTNGVGETRSIPSLSLRFFTDGIGRLAQNKARAGKS
ncbi:hypothetical protein [Ensifer sp. ZNC0028]|uniref:DUF6894 family protein n=1 Tax=Ensifer sp. ZNC0028 TaxID=1339236 RepID=UPI0005BBBA47